jgi:hypothetical protein
MSPSLNGQKQCSIQYRPWSPTRSERHQTGRYLFNIIFGCVLPHTVWTALHLGNLRVQGFLFIVVFMPILHCKELSNRCVELQVISCALSHQCVTSCACRVTAHNDWALSTEGCGRSQSTDISTTGRDQSSGPATP